MTLWLLTSRQKDAIAEARALVGSTLCDEPAQDHIERPQPPSGATLIGGMTIPDAVTLLPPVNKLLKMNRHKQTELKRRIKAIGFPQLLDLPRVERPYIRALRLSTVEPDWDSAWPKWGVDLFTKRGIIADDKPKVLKLDHWWEPGPRGKSVGYFEIWEREK